MRHFRKSDKREKCELDDCTSPPERIHKRVDDMLINKNSLYIRLFIAVLLGAAGSLGATTMAGWMLTPDKLQARIDNSPAIIQLKDKVDSLERNLTMATTTAEASRLSIDERLFNMNGQLAAVARTVGAPVVTPKPKPPIRPADMKPAESAHLHIRWAW